MIAVLPSKIFISGEKYVKVTKTKDLSFFLTSIIFVSSRFLSSYPPLITNKHTNNRSQHDKTLPKHLLPIWGITSGMQWLYYRYDWHVAGTSPADASRSSVTTRYNCRGLIIILINTRRRCGSSTTTTKIAIPTLLAAIAPTAAFNAVSFGRAPFDERQY